MGFICFIFLGDKKKTRYADFGACARVNITIIVMHNVLDQEYRTFFPFNYFSKDSLVRLIWLMHCSVASTSSPTMSNNLQLHAKIGPHSFAQEWVTFQTFNNTSTPFTII